jgi:hypothetical protein
MAFFSQQTSLGGTTDSIWAIKCSTLFDTQDMRKGLKFWSQQLMKCIFLNPKFLLL